MIVSYDNNKKILTTTLVQKREPETLWDRHYYFAPVASWNHTPKRLISLSSSRRDVLLDVANTKRRVRETPL